MSELAQSLLLPTWDAFVHRAAVLAAAFTALLALLAGAPVDIACLRGALTWAAALATGRLARWLIARVVPSPEDEVPDVTPAEEEEVSTLKASEAVGR